MVTHLQPSVDWDTLWRVFLGLQKRWERQPVVKAARVCLIKATLSWFREYVNVLHHLNLSPSEGGVEILLSNALVSRIRLHHDTILRSTLLVPVNRVGIFTCLQVRQTGTEVCLLCPTFDLKSQRETDSLFSQTLRGLNISVVSAVVRHRLVKRSEVQKWKGRSSLSFALIKHNSN